MEVALFRKRLPATPAPAACGTAGLGPVSRATVRGTGGLAALAAVRPAKPNAGQAARSVAFVPSKCRVPARWSRPWVRRRSGTDEAVAIPRDDDGEARAETQVTYVTRRYRRAPDQLDGRYGTAIAAYPGSTRGGFALAQENDAWALSISGSFGAVPPMDDDGMAAWAAEMDCQDVATLLRTSAPLGDPV
ncbi:hypothetical protein ACFYR1_25855 [Streptomyces canus]|uniref:hypothetical protein n=1 Tax=Streptomyces canus TaxID=58343 RepID=UPI00367BFA48